MSGKKFRKKCMEKNPMGQKFLATRGRGDFVKFYLAPPKCVLPLKCPPKFRDLAPPLSPAVQSNCPVQLSSPTVQSNCSVQSSPCFVLCRLSMAIRMLYLFCKYKSGKVRHFERTCGPLFTAFSCVK